MDSNEDFKDVKKISPSSECFYLSKILNAHSNDVKSVVTTSTGSILSSSRDGSIKLWTERSLFIYYYFYKILFYFYL